MNLKDAAEKAKDIANKDKKPSYVLINEAENDYMVSGNENPPAGWRVERIIQPTDKGDNKVILTD